MPESARERRSSRMRPPVSKGVPIWIYIGLGAVVAIILFLAVVYPVYHRGAVVKAAASMDSGIRRWAADEAVVIGADKLLEPLIEAGGACPPEAAVDFMNIIIKITERTTQEYFASKVRKFAVTWASDPAAQKRLASAKGLTTYFGFTQKDISHAMILQNMIDGNRETLLLLIKDPDQAVRKEVAGGILIPCKASSEIALVGLDDKDMQVRKRSADALMAVTTPDAIQMLLSHASKSSDTGTKATIIRALARRENAVKVGSMGFSPFLSDPSTDVRKEAIVAITHAGDAYVSDLLIKMLEDPSSDVRHEVIMNALYRRDKKVGLAAADRLLVEPSTEVKTRILKAVGPLSLAEAKDKIVALALKKNEPVEVRTAALSAIGNLNLSKPEERYPMIDTLMPAIEDENQEVSRAAQSIAGEYMTGTPPRNPADWRKWMDEKRPIINLLIQIAEFVKQGDTAFAANNQPDGDAAYFKAVDLYDEIMKICPEGEKTMFEKRQQLLNMERYKKQKGTIIDIRGGGGG